MNSRLEEYLGEAEAKLQGLPVSRRLEEIDEMRQHLAAAVQAHEELGLGTEAATEEALSKFGRAGQVGASLQRAWWREQVSGSRGLWKATAVAVAVPTTIHSFVTPFLTTAVVWQNKAQAPLPHFVLVTFVMLMSLLVPVASGVALARISPRHAIASVALASAVVGCLSLLHLGLLAALNLPSINAIKLSNIGGLLLQRLVEGVVTMLTAWVCVRQARMRLVHRA